MPFTSVHVGDWEILSIQAQPERVVVATEMFPDATTARLEELLADQPEFFAGDATHLRFTQNIFVVRGRGLTAIVDTGIPVDVPDALVLDGLGEAGLSPDDFDLVVFTHRDLDHVGGSLRDGEVLYRNARYVIGRTEINDYRTDAARHEPYLQHFKPLEDAGVVEIVEDDAEITPGLRFLFTPGHRTGATSLLIDDVALILADVWHCSLQVAQPDWSIRFDSDFALAAETRRAVVNRAEREKWLVGVPHTPFGGLGYVKSGRWRSL